MGGPRETTQRTTYELAPEQRDILNLAMPGVREYAATAPQRYQGSTIAGFDPMQLQAQESALRAAGEQQRVAQGAADSARSFSSDIWNPASNPQLAGAITAATRPITQQLLENTLPSIRGEAVTSGNFGSSRQGVAEGLASGRASQAVGDTAAKLAQSTYDTNINAQQKALALTPMIQDALMRPAAVQSGVGDVRQGMTQALLNQDIGNFNYDNNARYLQARDLIGLLGAIPGGTNVATATAPGPTAMQGMGGALAGAQLGTAIMPGIGTGVGAVAGGLLPFLFG